MSKDRKSSPSPTKSPMRHQNASLAKLDLMQPKIEVRNNKNEIGERDFNGYLSSDEEGDKAHFAKAA